jgi:L-glyceraldehyde 3-phosphate reductase
MDLLDDRRRLGRSGLRVSSLSLGSWRTFERIGFDASLQVLRHARALGINFLDDARYTAETSEAELETGWSEVLFGRLFAASGWSRDEVVIANKLWWEHWPREDAPAELRGSLERMGLDHVDLIYAVTRPEGLTVGEAVEQVGVTLRAGLAHHWGVANWNAADLTAATDLARRRGLAPPVAIQLPYNLIDRSSVENDAMLAALEGSGASLIPSAVLAGGVLTGKYQHGETGRMHDQLDEPHAQAALAVAAELSELGAQLGVSPAALALAFALDGPYTASVLFGATSVKQLDDNAGAVALHRTLDAETRARLRAIGRH